MVTDVDIRELRAPPLEPSAKLAAAKSPPRDGIAEDLVAIRSLITRGRQFMGASTQEGRASPVSGCDVAYSAPCGVQSFFALAEKIEVFVAGFSERINGLVNDSKGGAYHAMDLRQGKPHLRSLFEHNTTDFFEVSAAQLGDFRVSDAVTNVQSRADLWVSLQMLCLSFEKAKAVTVDSSSSAAKVEGAVAEIAERARVVVALYRNVLQSVIDSWDASRNVS